MLPEDFSTRLGLRQQQPVKYTADIPTGLRPPIVEIVRRYTSADHRRARLKAIFNPYGTNAGPDPLEIEDVFLTTEWFRMFDVIESIYQDLYDHDREFMAPDEEPRSFPFRQDINDYFVYEGVGWQLDDQGKFVARGDDNFQQSVDEAIPKLQETQRPTAASHLRSAVKALSERPSPNTAGAVSHATSAVEALLSDITGETMTLGKYLDKYPKLFHPALRKALDGLYGYASDAGARHGKEGVQPSLNEARFAVTTCAATCTLLVATNPNGVL
jgi:AbiJ N-terminal domain 4